MASRSILRCLDATLVKIKKKPFQISLQLITTNVRDLRGKKNGKRSKFQQRSNKGQSIAINQNPIKNGYGVKVYVQHDISMLPHHLSFGEWFFSPMFTQ